MTLFHELFDATVERAAARPALRYRDRQCSYAELQERSCRLAAALRRLGVQKGDRVLIYLQNRPEVVEAALACSRLGAIFVPASPMLRQRQLEHVLRDSGAKVLLSSTSALVPPAEVCKASPSLVALVICGEPAGALPLRSVRYEELMEAPPLDIAAPAIDCDAAAILYTSGSTGKPKGVVVSHRNLVSGARSVSSYLENVPDDRLLAALPLSFDYGFSQVSTAFTVGACAVLTNFSTAAALVQEVGAARITGLAGVPTMWAHLAASEWPAGAAESLRYITNSGGTLAAAILGRLRSKLPKTKIFCMYGLTEAFRSTYLDPRELDRKPGSIGKAIPNQEVLVLRPDGTRCAPGEVGELVHRGSLVTLGYWNDAERTLQRFRPVPTINPGLVSEIAVWSGDLVRADEEGFLYFVGRKDELIKTSGYRVSPTEIEEVVLEVPGVLEAVAVGAPDEVLGQKILVAIVVEAGTGPEVVDAVRQHTRMQLPAYMTPAHVQIVGSIARNSNGKPDRHAVLLELQASIAAEASSPVARAHR
ncbi:MAG TPA: acyl-CoA ligase (AMP-forming), exosortase A system-associated [Steroidobacter sp.]